MLKERRPVLGAHQAYEQLDPGSVVDGGLRRLEANVRGVDVQVGVHLRTLGILGEKLLGFFLRPRAFKSCDCESRLAHCVEDRVRQCCPHIVSGLVQDSRDLRGRRGRAVRLDQRSHDAEALTDRVGDRDLNLVGDAQWHQTDLLDACSRGVLERLWWRDRRAATQQPRGGEDRTKSGGERRRRRHEPEVRWQGRRTVGGYRVPGAAPGLTPRPLFLLLRVLLPRPTTDSPLPQSTPGPRD